MKEYDCNKPLIHIHIPKTGGSSVKEVYKKWFNDGLLFHYTGHGRKMPQKHDLEALQARHKDICIYGHFNRRRNFGIEHYYPEVDQFITILRDPFEKAVSGYFYMRKNSANIADQTRVPKEDLREFLLKRRTGSGMLNNFPREVTMDNFKEIIEAQFIEIGVLEYLDESMRRIASKLKYTIDPGSMQLLNTTKRDQRIPYEVRDEFIEMKPLDYAVYNYVLSKYTQQNAAPDDDSATLHRRR